MQDSDHDSDSDDNREGAADEGVDGWAERKEDERRRRGRNGETEVRNAEEMNYLINSAEYPLHYFNIL